MSSALKIFLIFLLAVLNAHSQAIFTTKIFDQENFSFKETYFYARQFAIQIRELEELCQNLENRIQVFETERELLERKSRILGILSQEELEKLAQLRTKLENLKSENIQAKYELAERKREQTKLSQQAPLYLRFKFEEERIRLLEQRGPVIVLPEFRPVNLTIQLNSRLRLNNNNSLEIN